MKGTLGVTILVVAAIAASLTLARQRQVERRPVADLHPGTPAVGADLDAIRFAGF